MRPALPDTKTREQHCKKGKGQSDNLSRTQMQNLQQNINKLNPTISKRITRHDQVGFIPGIQVLFDIQILMQSITSSYRKI